MKEMAAESSSIPSRIFVILFIGLECFQNLAISGDGTADDAEDGKNGDHQTLCTQPGIQIAADKEAEYYAANHGQPQLQHDLEMGGPLFVLFEVNHHL